MKMSNAAWARVVGTACALALVWFDAGRAYADELTLKVIEKETPGELSSDFKLLLDTQHVLQLSNDKGPLFEFWFRKDIALKEKPTDSESGLKSIPALAFVGAAKVYDYAKDFRNDDLDRGVFTMRFAMQPQDGNHLGTSPFPYFVLLVPAKLDTQVDGITSMEVLNDLSRKETAADHPNNLNLQPLSAGDASGEFPRLGTNGDQWKLVYLNLNASVEGSGEKAPLQFGLVYSGHGKL